MVKLLSTAKYWVVLYFLSCPTLKMNVAWAEGTHEWTSAKEGVTSRNVVILKTETETQSWKFAIDKFYDINSSELGFYNLIWGDD